MIDLVIRTQYFGSKVAHDLMRWWTKVHHVSNWRMDGRRRRRKWLMSRPKSILVLFSQYLCLNLLCWRISILNVLSKSKSLVLNKICWHICVYVQVSRLVLVVFTCYFLKVWLWRWRSAHGWQRAHGWWRAYGWRASWVWASWEWPVPCLGLIVWF